MNRSSDFTLVTAAAIMIGVGLWGSLPQPPASAPLPAVPAPVMPAPKPAPAPKKPDRPWADCEAPVGTPRVLGVDEPAVDLLSMPSNLRPRNCGGRDGAGLCVFTSIQYAATWQNEPKLKDLQKHMKGEPGGGYPSKVAAMITKYGPGAKYIQYEGRDPSIIELALRTGRVPCITWQGNHMLCCVYLDQSRAAILDNNAPDRLSWFDRNTFLSKWTAGGGGWVVVLLQPAPPPPPKGPPMPQDHAREEPAGGVQNDYRWEDGSRPDTYTLWDQRGKQVGFWDGYVYRPLINGSFAAPCEAPCALPFRELSGVSDWTRRENVYLLNGRPATRAKALRAFAGASIEADVPDDSVLPHLTIIGPAADRAPVEEDLRSNPALAGVLGQYRVQSYDPSEWAVQGFGFAATGHPTIYVQDPCGKVLHHQEDYAGGAEALANAIRRPDPNYKPAADPDRRKAPLLPFAMPPWMLAIPGAMGGFVAAGRRR